MPIRASIVISLENWSNVGVADALDLFFPFLRLTNSFFAVLPSTPHADMISTYIFWIFAFNDSMIFTAVQSRCFKTAIRRCSLPISVLSRRFASFPASSRIDSADFVYLLFSAPKVPPANGIWLKILMIDCIVTPFSCKTTNGAVSLTKVSAISRCSLPI